MHTLQQSLVSFVVPLFNGRRYIVETIDSVLQQTHQTLEIIIVDDGSTDGSPDYVSGAVDDSRVRIIEKAHSGIARTRNIGLDNVSPASDFVVFLDQDDVLATDMVESLLSVLSVRENAVGAYAVADYIDSNGAPFGDGYFAREMRTRQCARGFGLYPLAATADVTLAELFLRNHVYPPSSVLLRTWLVKAIGGCDTSYTVADDWDLMVKVLRFGPIVPFDEVRVGYRRHSSNASGDLQRNIRETRMVWSRTYFSSENTRRQRQSLQRSWRAAQWDKARRKLRMAASRQGPSGLGSRIIMAADGCAHAVLFCPLPWWRGVLRPPAPGQSSWNVDP